MKEIDKQPKIVPAGSHLVEGEHGAPEIIVPVPLPAKGAECGLPWASLA